MSLISSVGVARRLRVQVVRSGDGDEERRDGMAGGRHPEFPPRSPKRVALVESTAAWTRAAWRRARSARKGSSRPILTTRPEDDPAWRVLVGRFVGAINGAVDRPQDARFRGSSRAQLFPHIAVSRPCAGCRALHLDAASRQRDAAALTRAVGFGDRAGTRDDDHRPCPSRRLLIAVAGTVQPASRSRRSTPPS